VENSAQNPDGNTKEGGSLRSQFKSIPTMGASRPQTPAQNLSMKVKTNGRKARE